MPSRRSGKIGAVHGFLRNSMRRHGSGEEYAGGMSFTVSFTGQRKDEGIVVESLAQAVACVWLLQPEQFPAAIWEIWELPETEAYEAHGHGRLVHKYPAPPDGGAAAA
jgi:hypothetical protein